MNRLLLLILVATLLAACSDDSGTTSDTLSDMSTGDSSTDSGGMDTDNGLSGEEVYGQLCAVCHGPIGEGTPQGYEVQHPFPDYYAWVVRNGRTGEEFPNSAMPLFGPEVISDRQLEEIWAFLDAVPQPTTGEALYVDYCSNCHATDARGGISGKNIVGKGGGDVREKCRSGLGGSDYAARQRYMTQFDTTTLTDDELGLISTYLESLPE